VRSDPASNGRVALELERRGLRVVLEPVAEFLEYSDHIARKRGRKRSPRNAVEFVARTRVAALVHDAAAEELGRPKHVPVAEVLAAAMPYVRDDLEVETCLTMGVPLRSWRRGEIDAAVSVGPLECMPNKIAEAQFCHAAEHERFLTLSLSLNGDPLDAEVLDRFAFEVHARFRAGRAAVAPAPAVA
jgi:predicted nucleotide-binding protein (sugar kinase/HSP70/actin superfamily)